MHDLTIEVRSITGKVLKPVARKEIALTFIQSKGLSLRYAANVFGVSVSCLTYKSKLKLENDLIADWLIRITNTHKRWGFLLCYYYLRNVQGFRWNHKRIYRIYCDLCLNLRIKPRKRIKRTEPEPLTMPNEANHTWSMDFMSDNLEDGRAIRSFNVLDDFKRYCLKLDIDISMPSSRVIRSLNQAIAEYGKPKHIRCDNGPEYVSHALQYWAKQQQIELLYIQPGKPTQNAYIERFNRTVRQELFDLFLFKDIEQMQLLATRWQWMYNHERPHLALGGYPPMFELV